MDGMRAERSLWKGLLAGVLAGLAATAAKAIAERIYAPKVDAPKVDAPGGSAFAEADWGLGLAAGAAYGALAEFYPEAASDGGKMFGLALMALTHGAGLQGAALQGAGLQGAGLPPTEVEEALEGRSERKQTSGAAPHLVFGTVAEQVRSYVRSVL